MVKYVFRRIVMMIPVLLGVSLIVFTLMYITPGDPAALILGDGAPPEAVEQLHKEMGLDDGFIIRFGRFLKDAVLHQDLGTCYQTKQPVVERIGEMFPNTLKLAAFSVTIAVVLGMVMGIISAVYQYSAFDNIAMLLFALKLKWLPASGFSSFKYMILPAVTIGTSSAAAISRMTRSSMLEVIRQDYITSARAKGQTEFMITMRHALKNALIPVITTIGMQFGNLLGGAVLTESIFAVPGIGKMMVDAIKARNFPVVQGGVLVVALAFSLVNLLVDILYAYIDPRIRSKYR